MPREKKLATTKTGVELTSCYCRKCMKNKSPNEFNEAFDGAKIDANGKFSVCKDCIQELYDDAYNKTNSMEKAIHSLCTSLNIMYSNESVASTKTHITTLLNSGKQVNAVFSIYLMKLVASKKSMDKSGVNDFQYEDIGTVFVTEALNTKEIPIPQEIVDFWGKEWDRDSIEFLQREYTNFTRTHDAETHPQVVLLKEVCYTMLKIRDMRRNSDPDIEKVQTALQNLMTKLNITPNSKANKTSKDEDEEVLGMWIADIEKYEPCQWLKNDPRGDIYRDVSNTEQYFNDYTRRPLKNLITGSKDFNVDDDLFENGDFDMEEDVFESASGDGQEENG